MVTRIVGLLPVFRAILVFAGFLMLGMSCSWAGSYSLFIRSATPNKTQAARSLMPAAESNDFRIDPVVGRSGEAVPVSIVLPADIDEAYKQAKGPVFIIFRNVPSEIRFSAGFRLTDSWAISIKDAGKLRLHSQATYAASLMLTVILHQGKNRQPLTREVSIHISLTETDTVSKRIAGTTAATTPSKLSNYMPLSAHEVAQELNRAETFSRAGDLQSARLIYAELADQGVARAALLMAQTYDPEILRGAFIIGLRPDIAKALEWYHKAAELGEDEATQRLQVLADR